jgi:hypothetical protein
MPRALGSNRAIRITSWSPSILLQPSAADDVGGRYAGDGLLGCLAAQEDVVEADEMHAAVIEGHL